MDRDTISPFLAPICLPVSDKEQGGGVEESAVNTEASTTRD